MPAHATQPAADSHRLVPQIEQVETEAYSRTGKELNKAFAEWLKESAFLTVKYGLINVSEEIAEMAGLTNNWDSYGATAPSSLAIENARRSLTELTRDLILPSTVVPSASGGVSAYFICGTKVAYIENYNDGTQALVMYDSLGNTNVLEVGYEIQSGELAGRITGFLG